MCAALTSNNLFMASLPHAHVWLLGCSGLSVAVRENLVELLISQGMDKHRRRQSAREREKIVFIMMKTNNKRNWLELHL